MEAITTRKTLPDRQLQWVTKELGVSGASRVAERRAVMLTVAGLLGGGGVPLAIIIGLAVVLVYSAFQLARIRSR